MKFPDQNGNSKYKKNLEKIAFRKEKLASTKVNLFRKNARACQKTYALTQGFLRFKLLFEKSSPLISYDFASNSTLPIKWLPKQSLLDGAF